MIQPQPDTHQRPLLSDPWMDQATPCSGALAIYERM